MLLNPLSAAYFDKIAFWFDMELDSPSARSSTDNLQYNAVILLDFTAFFNIKFHPLSVYNFYVTVGLGVIQVDDSAIFPLFCWVCGLFISLAIRLFTIRRSFCSAVSLPFLLKVVLTIYVVFPIFISEVCVYIGSFFFGESSVSINWTFAKSDISTSPRIYAYARTVCLITFYSKYRQAYV